MKTVSGQKAVVITGSAGGIGRAMVDHMKGRGLFTIGIDRVAEEYSDAFLHVDLFRLVNAAEERAAFRESIDRLLEGRSLAALINNAAFQCLGPTESLALDDFRRSMDINVAAPFFLTQCLFERLSAAVGVVLNVSSVHADLTKPGFVAYATSKGALSALTRALAVDCGDRVKVVGISPAAIATPMLEASFEGAPDRLAELKDCHPTRSIGRAADVAALAGYLILESPRFINGAIVDLDGGIGGRLYDPV